MRNQQRNLTFSPCIKPFNTVYLVFNSILLFFGIPTTIIVVVKLLIGLFKTRSFSQTDFFLLQISVVNICFFVACLLLFLDDQVSMTLFLVLYIPSLTVRPVFSLVICVICYFAVVHPVTYMAAKTMHHWEWLVSTLGWLYSLIMAVVIMIYDIDIFQPIFVVVFNITILPSVFCNIGVLRALASSGTGRDRQTLNLAKRKAFLIVLSFVVAFLMYYIPRVYVFIYSYIAPVDWERFECTEGSVILMVSKFSEVAIPVVCLYSLRKLDV